MKSFLTALLGDSHKDKDSGKKTDIPRKSAQRHRPEANETGLRSEIPSAPPRVVSGTIAEKEELARWLVATFIKSGSVSLPFVLERMLDFRFCSLTAYYLSLEIFSSYGVTFVGESIPVINALGLTPEKMPSGRVSDVGQTTSLAMPAKYRGYGNPINSPESRGHLFQINMCSFAEKNAVIGYQDWNGASIVTFKGMKPCGTSGAWKLFELDPSRTDDMTAVFLCNSQSNLQIELAHFVEGEEKPRMFYRYSSTRGEKIEDHSKDYDNAN